MTWAKGRRLTDWATQAPPKNKILKKKLGEIWGW